MNLVLANANRLLISVSRDALVGINNAVNEICNDGDLDDSEFQTRLGCSRAELREVLRGISGALSAAPASSSELVSSVRDGSAVQVRAISVFGDPIDMSGDEARAFAEDLLAGARDSDA